MIEAISFIIILALSVLMVTDIKNLHILSLVCGFLSGIIVTRIIYEIKIYKIKKRYIDGIAKIRNVPTKKPLKLPSNVIPFPLRSSRKKK